ncbi:MAG: response regulator [Candidatus Competibacteraceae bacterium]|nr:response regulator [Candidatus Competibacteraceae bacterium]
MPVRHVLVVDDSKSARLMLRKMLQGFGMTVDTAESAEEALNYLRDRQPDAIFMDHTMPGMDGLTAVRQIKENPAIAAIPVAMYTSRDEPTYLQEARAAGAIEVLTKPAMPEMLGVLLERMHQALDAAQAPITAPTPEEGGGSVSVEWVEKIVVDKAESVIYDAIESQVLPLLNDVIAKLRQEMDAGQAKTCGQVAERICQEQLTAWQSTGQESAHLPLTEDAIRAQLAPLLDQRLAAFQTQERAGLEDIARDIAGQVCTSQLHELSERLVRQLSARFAEAVRKAASTAHDAAIEAAREVAIEAARSASLPMPGEAPVISSQAESVTAAVEQAAHQLWADARRDLGRRIYWAAGCAAAVGVGAAIVAYGLR